MQELATLNIDPLFLEIGIIIISATLLAYFGRIIRQPLIPMYILTGVIIGPFGLGLIKNHDIISGFSEIGIAFLLFVVGLDLEFKRLRDIGLVASLGTTLQLFLLFSFGYLIAFIMGIFTSLELIYIGLILAFSSTMVVVKLLSDKKELDTLHGRIIIGMLLMQDIFAVLAISMLATLSEFTVALLIFALLKAVIVFGGSLILSRYIFPVIFRFAARSQELLFLLSITVCFLFAIGAHMIGFSIAIGGFIAGVTLGNLPYNLEIISRVKPLRDFFSTLFFVSLGMELVLTGFGVMLMPLIIFTLFVLLFKPFVTMVICSVFEYTKQTSFMTSAALAQISEFSLIIAAQGLMMAEPISRNIFSLAVMLAVITITVTTYAIKYDHELYSFMANKLGIFEKIGKNAEHLKFMEEKGKYDVILVGFDRIGYSIAKTLHRIDKNWLIVDFNPDIIKKLIKQKIHCLYGDIGDIEILERLNLRSVEMVVSTIPDKQDNLLLIKKLKSVNEKATIFVTANKVEEALELYDFGADYVILPHFLGGDHVSIILEDITTNFNKIIDNKLRHIEELKLRKSLGHEHPYHHLHHKHNH